MDGTRPAIFIRTRGSSCTPRDLHVSAREAAGFAGLRGKCGRTPAVARLQTPCDSSFTWITKNSDATSGATLARLTVSSSDSQHSDPSSWTCRSRWRAVV